MKPLYHQVQTPVSACTNHQVAQYLKLDTMALPTWPLTKHTSLSKNKKKPPCEVQTTHFYIIRWFVAICKSKTAMFLGRAKRSGEEAGDFLLPWVSRHTCWHLLVLVRDKVYECTETYRDPTVQLSRKCARTNSCMCMHAARSTHTQTQSPIHHPGPRVHTMQWVSFYTWHSMPVTQWKTIYDS